MSDEFRVDVAMVEDNSIKADVSVVDGDLLDETSMRTAIMVSLFSDRRADDTELSNAFAPSSQGPVRSVDPRGWWGDELATVGGDQWGSKLWLLAREKQTQATLTRAEAYVREALRWLIDDGIARQMTIETQWMHEQNPRDFPLGIMGIRIEIVRPNQINQRYAFTWSGV